MFKLELLIAQISLSHCSTLKVQFTMVRQTGDMSPEKVEVSLINEPSNAEAVAGTTTAMSLEPNNNSLVSVDC